MELIGQLIGIVAMLINIFAVQFKKPRHLFICRLVASALWGLNFLLLGSPTGAIINIVNILRSIFLLNKKTTTKPFLVITVVLYALCGLLTLDPASVILVVIDLLIVAAQAAESVAMWTEKFRYIRYTQLFGISPVWLAHNILVFSIGGIITEIFTMISTVIAMYRYRKSS